MLRRFEKFTFFIEETARILHKIMADEMAAYGLKGPASIYLLTLSMHPEGLTVSAVSERSGRDKADVSRVLASLDKSGLVEKKDKSKSCYRALIVLTDAGRAATERLRVKATKAVEFASKGVSAEEREIFYSTMEIIYNNLSEMSLRGVPGGDA
jgi:DNA-binding MarR family transcriptional regulator